MEMLFATTDLALPVINIIGATTSIFLALFLTDSDHRYQLGGSEMAGNSTDTTCDSAGMIALWSFGFHSTDEAVDLKNDNNCNHLLVDLKTLTAVIIERLQQEEVSDAIQHWKELEFRVRSVENETIFSAVEESQSGMLLVHLLSHILNKIVTHRLQFVSISPFVQQLDLDSRIQAYNLTLNHFTEFTGQENENAGISVEILNLAKFVRDDYEWFRNQKKILSIAKKIRLMFDPLFKRFPNTVKTMVFTTRVSIRSASKDSTNNYGSGYLYATGNKAFLSPQHYSKGKSQRPVFLWTDPSSNYGVAKEGKWELLYDGNESFTIFNPFWRENLCASTGSTGSQENYTVFTSSQYFESTMQCSWKIIFDDSNYHNVTATASNSVSGPVRIFAKAENADIITLLSDASPTKSTGTTSTSSNTRNYRSKVYTASSKTTEKSIENVIGNAGWVILPLAFIF